LCCVFRPVIHTRIKISRHSAAASPLVVSIAYMYSWRPGQRPAHAARASTMRTA